MFATFYSSSCHQLLQSFFVSILVRFSPGSVSSRSRFNFNIAEVQDWRAMGHMLYVPIMTYMDIIVNWYVSICKVKTPPNRTLTCRRRIFRPRWVMVGLKCKTSWARCAGCCKMLYCSHLLLWWIVKGRWRWWSILWFRIPQNSWTHSILLLSDPKFSEGGD